MTKLGKNPSTRTRRQSAVRASEERLLFAVARVLLAVEPSYESEKYLMARAKLLSAYAVARQVLVPFEGEDENETTPDPEGGESGVSS